MRLSHWVFMNNLNYPDSYKNKNGQLTFKSIDLELADKVCPTWRRWSRAYYSPFMRNFLKRYDK